MFLKILKWDLKSQRKIFILFLLYGLSIVNLGLTKVVDVDWLIGIAMLFHVVLAVVVITAPLVLLAINYYGDLYGKNAYTMHQLAAKTSTILNAKILSGVTYTLLSFVLVLVGSLMTNAIFNGYTATAEVIRVVADTMSAFSEVPNHIENVNAFVFWLILVLLIALGLFASQIYYAFIVTLANGKVLRKLGKGSLVASFFVVYIGGQIVTTFNTLYVPLSVVVERSTAALVRLSFSAQTVMALSKDPAIGQLLVVPVGPFLVTTLFAALGYLYVAYSLNNNKNIV